MSEYPSWLKLAFTFEGTREIPDDKHNPNIVEFLRVASGGKILPDETNWCAASVIYPLIKSGYQVPLTLSAKEMMNIGLKNGQFIEIKKPRLGCIVIMKCKNATESWQAHTGFWLDHDQIRTKDLIYGGNQSNGFIQQWFDKSLVIAYLWPTMILTFPEIKRIAKFRGSEWTNSKMEPLPEIPDTPNIVITEIQESKSNKFMLAWYKLLSGLKVMGWVLVDIMKIYPATKEAGQAITNLIKGDKNPKETPKVEQTWIQICLSFIKELFEKLVTWLKKKGTKV
ncbi:MAG: TIGR02594 family protein [Bacteroidales bacterium]|jgi:uncharacterized protein (TIGR02594 family)